jgi:hypothetical protein
VLRSLPAKFPMMSSDHMGGMMWGMGLGGLLALAIVVLLIAALIKYLLFR